MIRYQRVWVNPDVVHVQAWDRMDGQTLCGRNLGGHRKVYRDGTIEPLVTCRLCKVELARLEGADNVVHAEPAKTTSGMPMTALPALHVYMICKADQYPEACSYLLKSADPMSEFKVCAKELEGTRQVVEANRAKMAAQGDNCSGPPDFEKLP